MTVQVPVTWHGQCQQIHGRITADLEAHTLLPYTTQLRHKDTVYFDLEPHQVLEHTMPKLAEINRHLIR
jgi:hypothetical protein